MFSALLRDSSRNARLFLSDGGQLMAQEDAMPSSSSLHPPHRRRHDKSRERRSSTLVISSLLLTRSIPKLSSQPSHGFKETGQPHAFRNTHSPDKLTCWRRAEHQSFPAHRHQLRHFLPCCAKLSCASRVH
jgi:hypothetical protein